MAGILEASLRSYKVEASVVEIQKGPVITMFEINVVEGTRVDRIRALEDDLAIRLKVPSVRIVAPIPASRRSASKSAEPHPRDRVPA